jgi:hypothetical protein
MDPLGPPHRPVRRFVSTPVQIGIACTVAFLVIAWTGQFQRAHHAHDDWFMHLPIAPERFLWYVETEGRWLTFLWSHLSHYLQPNQTYLLSTCLLAISTAALTLSFYTGTRAGLVFLALFFSPFAADIMQWSAQQVAALTVLSLTSVVQYGATTQRRQLVIAVIGQIAAFLSYAGIAPLILLQLAFKRSGARADLLLRLASFPVALVIAALIMSGVNGLVFGTFGIAISDWREPNPLIDLSSGIANLDRFWDEQSALLASFPAYVLLVGATAALGLTGRSASHRGTTVLAACAVIVGYEVAITVVTGVLVPSRTRTWLWVAPLIVCVQVLDAPRRARQWAGAFVVFLFFLVGARHWVGFYATAQQALGQQEALATRAVALRASPQDRVVYYGHMIPVDLLEYRFFAVLPQARWFLDYARAVHGLNIEPCDGAECTSIVSHPPPDAVFRLEGGPVALRFGEP